MQNVFAGLLRKLQDGLSDAIRKNPEIGRQILKVVPTVKKYTYDAPEFNFAETTAAKVNTPFKVGGVDLGQQATALALGVPQGIMNVPAQYVKGITRTGVDYGKQLRGEKVSVQKQLSSMAPLAEALLTVGTMGVGTSILKNAGKNVGKKTIQSVLKQGTKEVGKQAVKQTLKTVLKQGAKEGVKFGAAYGAIGGLRESENASFADMIRTVERRTIEGAGAGLIAGPIVAGSLHGVGKGIKAYKNIPKKTREGGFVDMKEIIAGKKGSIPEPVSSQVEGDVQIREILKSRLEQVKATKPNSTEFYVKVGKLAKEFGIDGKQLGNVIKKNKFDIAKVEAALYKDIDYPGVRNRLGLVVDRLKTDNWTKPKEEFVPTNKSFMQEPVATPQEAAKQKRTINEILASQTKPTVERAVKMRELKQPTPEVAAQVQTNKQLPIDQRIAQLDQVIAPKDLVGPEDFKPHFKYGIEEAKDIFRTIEAEAKNRGYDSKRFVDAVEHPDGLNLNPDVADLITAHKNLFEKLRVMTEKPDVGEIQNYFPHADLEAQQQMTNLFGDNYINRLNIDAGFLQKRTGKRTVYPKEYAKVGGDYAEQVFLTKYRDQITPLTEAQTKIIEHVGNLDPEAKFDYLGELQQEPPIKPIDKLPELPTYEKYTGKNENIMGVINYKITAQVFRKPLRTANDLFSKIGGPVFEAFRKYRDARATSQNIAREIDGMIVKDKNKVIPYLADQLELKGQDRLDFIAHSTKIANQIGLKRFSESVVKQFSTKRIQLQDFIDTVTQFEFKDGITKEFVNDFIDTALKTGVAEQNLRSKILDNTARVFARAQIGGNIKVAVVQPLEFSRAFAIFKTEDITAGMKTGFKESKRIHAEYGLDETRAIQEAIYHKSTKPGKVMKVIDDKILFAPLKATEEWKNVQFAAVAEAEGKRMGLTGKDLFTHVRNKLYQYAHAAMEHNTPVLMQDSAVARALLQYSQFTLKNAFGKIDAFQKNKGFGIHAKGEFYGLLASDMINIAVISGVMGVPIEYAIKNYIPFFNGKDGGLGGGPILSIIPTIWDDIAEIQSNAAKGNAAQVKASTGKFMTDLLQNFVPAGAQIKKTSTMADMLQKGYSASPTGLVEYPAPTNPLEQAQGLAFGPNSTASEKQYQEAPFYGTPLGENQSEAIKSSLKAGDPETARKIYDAIGENKIKATEEKKIANAMTEDQGLNELDIIQTRRNAVQNFIRQGMTDPKQIYSAINYNEKGQKVGDFTVSEIESYSQNTANDIYSILAKKKQFEADNRLIDNVMFGDYKNLDKQAQAKMLQNFGIDETKMQAYEVNKIKSLGTMDTADYIIGQEEPDFVALYKNGALTQGVADELQRRKFILDADALMKKLKATDPVLIAEQNEKTMKKILTRQKKITRKVISPKRLGIKSLLSTKITTRRPKKVKLLSLKAIKVPKAKVLKVKKLKLKFLKY